MKVDPPLKTPWRASSPPPHRAESCWPARPQVAADRSGASRGVSHAPRSCPRRRDH